MPGERIVVELHYLETLEGTFVHRLTSGVEVEFRRTPPCGECEAACPRCGHAHCACCGEQRPDHLAAVHSLDGALLCGVCLGSKLSHGACPHETGQVAAKGECAEGAATIADLEGTETTIH